MKVLLSRPSLHSTSQSALVTYRAMKAWYHPSIGAVFAQPLKAAAPAPVSVTAALIDAARRESKVSFYTALETRYQRLDRQDARPHRAEQATRPADEVIE